MSNQDATLTGTTPGFKCPECGFHIPVSIAMLLNNSAVFCSSCGLKLSIDHEESREGLDQLKKFDTSIKEAEKIKKSLLK